MSADIWLANDTHVGWVCKMLLDGETITHIDAIENEGFHRLSQPIYLLRHKYKWPIETECFYDKGIPNLAHYRLVKGIDKSNLVKPPSYFKKRDDKNVSSTKIRYKRK